MAELAGTVATGMAHAPLPTDGNKADKGERESTPLKRLLSVLGSASFLTGDGKTYPRQTGFGANRKPHPDGGTNETVAWIVFKPFKGLDISHEGRIYCEKYVENGRNMRSYSISLPFLKTERRDNSGREAVEALKLHLRDSYRKWVAANKDTVQSAVSKSSKSADAWIEAEEAPTDK